MSKDGVLSPGIYPASSARLFFRKMNASDAPQQTRVVPAEGWHVCHLFYRVDNASWDMLGPEGKMEARTNFLSLIKEARDMPDTQLLCFSMLTPKADIGFMLLTPDLHTVNRLEKRLTLSLGPDILLPAYSYLSLTERSEYTTTEEEFVADLEKEKGLKRGDPGFEEAVAGFRERMEKYAKHRLYPVLPEWPVACFYAMSKRRGEKYNWYELTFERRKELMAGHARVGRAYSGRILQLITGSTGLDEMEWFVTLFAHDSADIKAIVHEMRFDPVSAWYADFGDFYIGLQLPPGDILARLQL